MTSKNDALTALLIGVVDLVGSNHFTPLEADPPCGAVGNGCPSHPRSPLSTCEIVGR